MLYIYRFLEQPLIPDLVNMNMNMIVIICIADIMDIVNIAYCLFPVGYSQLYMYVKILGRLRDLSDDWSRCNSHTS